MRRLDFISPHHLEAPRLKPGALRVLGFAMDDSRPGREPIDLAEAFFRRHGIGAAQMRKLRIQQRCGNIACTRLAMAEALEEQTGRREPHW